MSDTAWNLWATKAPPCCTVETTQNYEAVNTMKSEIVCAIKILDSIKPSLHSEAAILSRYLYRYKRTFRHDKSIQYLTQVKQGLLRYMKLNMSSVLLEFKSCLPSAKALASKKVRLPSRQMLQFVLVRLQAFAQLMLRLLQLTYHAVQYIYGKIQLRWSAVYTYTALSLGCRLHVCFKYLASRSIEWYNNLQPTQNALNLTAEFLADHHFPLDLNIWLGNPRLDKLPLTKHRSQVDRVFDLIDIADSDEDVEIVDNLHDTTKAESSFQIEAQRAAVLSHVEDVFKLEDVGMPVRREEVEKKTVNKKKKKRPREDTSNESCVKKKKQKKEANKVNKNKALVNKVLAQKMQEKIVSTKTLIKKSKYKI